MKKDSDVYSQSIKMALKVEFLTNSEELFLYAGALYSAMIWGRGIDEKNELIQGKDTSVK